MTNLLPQVGQSSALERKYAKFILKANPGLGEKAGELASSLVESGLPGAAATMLLQSVYAPNNAHGRGQSTRAKWFIEAVRTRYSHRLEKIQTDYKAFRFFLGDMEEVVSLRDDLCGEGLSVTYHDAFNLWELGESADSIMRIMADIDYRRPRSGMLRRAVMAVRNGQFTEVETALAYLNPRTRSDD